MNKPMRHDYWGKRVDYKDLLARLQAQDSSWTFFWDDNAQAAYLYDSAGSVFSSFETNGTVSLKSEWAQALGLGGIIVSDGCFVMGPSGV